MAIVRAATPQVTRAKNVASILKLCRVETSKCAGRGGGEAALGPLRRVVPVTRLRHCFSRVTLSSKPAMLHTHHTLRSATQEHAAVSAWVVEAERPHSGLCAKSCQSQGVRCEPWRVAGAFPIHTYWILIFFSARCAATAPESDRSFRSFLTARREWIRICASAIPG